MFSKKTFTNFAAAVAELEAVTPRVGGHSREGEPDPAGMPLFHVIITDTSETHVRDDGVTWDTGGTRSWEICQPSRDGKHLKTIRGYYCQDRGGLGF